MVRRVKPEEYAARRAQILATALELIRRKGYQEMTISDVLTSLEISKGAFYHYFDSKRALLDGIVDEMTASASATLTRVVAEPAADALSKLRTYLLSAVDWKAAHDAELAAIARMWRHENNALLKQRVVEASVGVQGPLLAAIIRQGRDEGVFTATYPDEAAVIIAGMGLQLGDALIDAFTRSEGRLPSRDRRAELVGAHLEALERVLGAPEGSLTALAPEIAGTPTAGG